MIEHTIPYAPEDASINRYNYQYLRLQGMVFCQANARQGAQLPALLLAFLAQKADEYAIDNVDIADCAGAVCFQVSLGQEAFERALHRYQAPFLAGQARGAM